MRTAEEWAEDFIDIMTAFGVIIVEGDEKWLAKRIRQIQSDAIKACADQLNYHPSHCAVHATNEDCDCVTGKMRGDILSLLPKD